MGGKRKAGGEAAGGSAPPGPAHTAVRPRGSRAPLGGEVVVGAAKGAKVACHRGSVLCLAWSEDGSRLCSGGRDNVAMVWDVGQAGAPPKLVASLGAHKDYVRGCCWRADGTMLATAGDDKARLWRTPAEAERLEREGGGGGEAGKDPHRAREGGFERVQKLEGHGGRGVKCCAWNADGTLLATGSMDKTARIWRAGGGAQAVEESKVLVGHAAGVECLAWSPDGTMLATAGSDGQIRVWQVESGECLQTLGESVSDQPGHLGGVLALAWSPDGGRLASGSLDAAARLWVREEGGDFALEHTLDHSTKSGPDEKTWVRALAFRPDGTQLATACGDPASDGAVRIWDIDAGGQAPQVSQSFTHAWSFASVAWSADGDRLAAGTLDSKFKVWSRGAA